MTLAKSFNLAELPEWFKERYVPVPESGCWLWDGGLTSAGYGRIKHLGRWVLAHRAFYALHKGDPGTMLVCHKCDTPLCVNPSHLFLGTDAENRADSSAKGRRPKVGERNGRAIITDKQAMEIRSSGLPSPEIAARYGISARAVRDIKSGRRWKHLSRANGGTEHVD